MMTIIKIFISFILFMICLSMCIYEASNNNMFCVVWAVNSLINYMYFNEIANDENDY